jgi:predicted enzyme related to lactoylglutathione lyase
MNSVSISIDVPDFDEGVRFFAAALGFTKSAAPTPGVVVMNAGNTEICPLEKRPGSKPSSHAKDTRRCERHWTPVHLDIHIDDLRGALDKALAAGAKHEQLFEDAKHGAAVLCSDPFGHGLCLIQRGQ